MNYDRHLVSTPWDDYELLDSGEHMKLERFGDIITARPETQALWKKSRPEQWEQAHAMFAFRDAKGAWETRKPVPDSWELSWNDLRFTAQLTGFKHTGIFPEQMPNWQWLSEKTSGLSKPASTRVGRGGPNVLNLFGYTGIATLAAARAGAFVTHVDASKQSLDWANDNARRSGLPENAIRWVLDDALAFAKREARRKAAYEGIILDPPAFGRGTKGEVWKIEEDLLALLHTLKELLSQTPNSFFLVNGYAAGYAPRSFAQAVESVFGETSGECGPPRLASGEAGELHIKESFSDRVVPAGIYVRFTR